MLSISAATILSRATGYLRWMAQAAVLATGLVADAYTASILLPSLIYELFMGGILYSIFIPVLVDRITTHGEDDARRLTNALFTLVLPLMLFLSLVGIVFAEPLVALVTNWQAADNLSPAEVEEVQGLAVLFFRIFILPMVVLVAASVSFQLFGTYLATGFRGGVASLNYAFTIFSLPYGVFVVAIATALMPELSEKYSRADNEGYRDTFSFGLRTMAFVVVPSAVGMISLSRPIVGLLYERGEFDAGDTEIVSGLLMVYAAGLLGYSVYFYLVRAFYSRQNTKTPAVLNVVIFLLYAALAYGLSRVWGITGVVLGLAAAYSVLAILSLVAMRRETGRLDGRRLASSLLRILVSGAAMYAVAIVGTTLFGMGSGFAGRLLVAVGGLSLAVYLGVAFLLGTEELKSVLALLRRRSAKKAAG